MIIGKGLAIQTSGQKWGKCSDFKEILKNVICHAAPGQNRSFRSQPNRVVGVIHEDDDVPFSPPKGTMGLLCTWGVCRGKPEVFDSRSGEPYVKVHLKVRPGSLHGIPSKAWTHSAPSGSWHCIPCRPLLACWPNVVANFAVDQFLLLGGLLAAGGLSDW